MPDKKISELDALPNGVLDVADEWVIQRAAADNFKVRTDELLATLNALYAPLTHVNDDSIHFVDAPADGNQYARQNNNWTIVTGGGGGPGTGVSSWNGRTGAVVPAANDYNSSQIQNVSAVAGSTVTNALNTLDANKAPINVDKLTQQAELLTYGGGDYVAIGPGAVNQVLTSIAGPSLVWLDVDQSINDGTLGNAKLGPMPGNTIKMRGQPTTGAPEDREIESLIDLGVPNPGDRLLLQKEGGDIGQVQVGNLPGGGGGGGIDPIFITHTWTLSGTFTNSTFVVPFLVASGAYNLKLVRVEALMESGAFTNAKIQQRTGAAAAVDVPGLTTMSVTAGVPATFTPTTGGGQPLANNDRLYLVWTDSFGGAADLQLSVVVSHQTAP